MKIMKNIKAILLAVVVFFASCESLVEGINDNPNKILPEEIESDLFLTGAMLANTVAQGGHLNRIAGMWSGQLTGFTSLYSNIYGYNISTAESVSTWSRFYIGVVPNVRFIRESVPDDLLLVGICKVIEAHAMGSAASLFGDVPYSQIASDEFTDPVFDNQDEVFRAQISLLQSAVQDLSQATSRTLVEDIYFEGNAVAWREAANTLIARYYLQLKEYGNAYTAAQSGISSAANTMKYTPRGDAAIVEGDKNLFFTILEGSRAGDIGTGPSYMMGLLDPANATSRNNAKTNETARHGYFFINEASGRANLGMAEQFEPQNLVSYQENQLILAETGARTVDFSTGLGHLNDLRAYLNTGDFLNQAFDTLTFQYDAYVAADFDAGGIENADGIDPTRALLREIIEERYISGFMQFMAFNDARRLRKSDSDLSVPFPTNVTSATQHPERMPYSDDELNSNPNGPGQDPGIYSVTRVNQ